MATNQDDTQLRRYLLGHLPDEDVVALEEDYFAREATLERIRAAEDDLIDDSLSGRLSEPERDRFDRHYLATPGHRGRVAVARELRAASRAAIQVPPAVESLSWLTNVVRALRGSQRPLMPAFAALLVILVLGGVWILRSRPAPAVVAENAPKADPRSTEAPAISGSKPEERPQRREAPGSAPSAAVVVALTLSPAGVRGIDDGTSLIIKPGTTLVVLDLEGDAGARTLERGRAVITTISGREIWRGPAAAERGTQPAAFARLEIPADKLPPDDYIVALIDADANGRETERYRYFLRVRAQ